jgi:hypothetical protein
MKMKTKKLVIAILTVLAFTGMLLSCDIGGEDYGSVVINLPEDGSARAAASLVTYQVSCNAPGTASQTVSGGRVYMPLPVGYWTVTVSMFKNNVFIGSGIGTVKITSGKTSSVPINISVDTSTISFINWKDRFGINFPEPTNGTLIDRVYDTSNVGTLWVYPVSIKRVNIPYATYTALESYVLNENNFPNRGHEQYKSPTSNSVGSVSSCEITFFNNYSAYKLIVKYDADDSSLLITLQRVYHNS